MPKQRSVVDAAMLAASAGNLSMMGQLFNKAKTRQEKGQILGLLAIEYILQHPGQPSRLSTALHILKLARSLLIDEWKPLCTCFQQELIIRRCCVDTKYAHGIIVGRAEAMKSRYCHLQE